MDRYEKVVKAILKYFGERKAKQLFLHGGCYFLADYLAKKLPNATIMINRQQEHCATLIGGSLYDISGKISKKNFRYATKRDLNFMKKNYIPQFRVLELEQYLDENFH